MSSKYLALLFAVVLIFALPATAATIRVPADQPTIQAGIDATVTGDTVLVASGTYTGDGNRDLKTYGKSIIVRSEAGADLCIIDCQGTSGDQHRGFNIRDGESRSTVIEGFTITNGYVGTYGSGIYCNGSSPTIRNNIITLNDAGDMGGGICCYDAAPLIIGNSISGNDIGILCRLTDTAIVIQDNHIFGNSPRAGIYCDHSNVLVIDNVISGNSVDWRGGGMYLTFTVATIAGNQFLYNWAGWNGGGISCYGSGQVRIINNLFQGNWTDDEGGGVFSRRCETALANNTFIGNSAVRGGAIYGESGAQIIATDCILWQNSAPEGKEIFMEGGSSGFMEISYLDIEGGESSVDARPADVLTWGPGMIDSDPLFVTGPEGDHYLGQIAAGQPTDSPCIDAGSEPASAVCHEAVESTLCMSDLSTRTDLITDEGIVDMGYHYPVAGDSSVPWIITGPGPGYDNPPLVRLFPPHQDAIHTSEFDAYGPQHYGVNVAVGDLDGDGYDEILSGPGPGEIFGPHVRGFDAGGTQLPGLSFLAYGTNKFGATVSAGDLDGDGIEEIITGAGPGEVFGPHVRAFDYDGGPEVTPMSGASFFAYGTLKWGVNVAAGDLDGDGFDEIVTGAGPGTVFGPHVRGWNLDGSAAVSMSGVSYFAYGTNQFGVRVACGDVDGDGMDEIITAPGPSIQFGAHVRGWNYDGAEIAPLAGFSFLAWPLGLAKFGATVSSGRDLDQNGRDELLVGAGPDPLVLTPLQAYRYNGSQVLSWFSLEAYPEGLTRGGNAAAGMFEVRQQRSNRHLSSGGE